MRNPAFGSLRTTKAQTNSTFVIHSSESIISNLAPSEIAIFLAILCSRGDLFESGFVGNPKDKFCHIETHIILRYLRMALDI